MDTEYHYTGAGRVQEGTTEGCEDVGEEAGACLLSAKMIFEISI